MSRMSRFLMGVMTVFVVASFARSVTSAPSPIPPDVGALAKGPSGDAPRRSLRPSAGGDHFRQPRPGLVHGDGGEKVTGAKGSTTEDPLHAYCNVACKDGMGSVVCDCPDHIIGRRSVEVNLAGRSMDAVPNRRFGQQDQTRRGRMEVTRLGEVRESPEMCEEWCREGLGGSACNCDLLPRAHNRPAEFQ
ncbi:uncharacterized protein LOC134787696 isoform X2 [Penaeus indicus]|uniref:uncharacterized protein LOC134787696 isoform X2 n=1 Tax=Penaeus indicus TaxID=29960 RepID=UPI00300C9843